MSAIAAALDEECGGYLRLYLSPGQLIIRAAYQPLGKLIVFITNKVVDRSNPPAYNLNSNHYEQDKRMNYIEQGAKGEIRE